ncbi:MAG: diadenylate cyclase [Phycisphaerae bacterium]|nr:diadenylate cyclase [Phycisphaerae bacterium]
MPDNDNANNIAASIIAASADVVRKTHAGVLFAYISAAGDLAALRSAIKKPARLVLVARNEDERHRGEAVGAETLTVPPLDLSRMGQIKMASLIAISQQLLKPDDVFVFLTGLPGGQIDSLITMRVGKEFELFQSVDQPKLTEHIRQPVFERVLRVALELGEEGREGKPVGTIFVIGDHRQVQKYYDEGRINPFRGYTEKERNILDDTIRDTVKEIAKLDGAFVIKGNGVIVAACAMLRPSAPGEELAQRLGARHAAAAGITAGTRAIAITLSESTGDVRVWRRGQMITELERSSRSSLAAHSGPPRTPPGPA